MTNELNCDILLIRLFTNTSIYTKYKSYISIYLLNHYKNNNKLLYKIYRCLVLLHEEHSSVSIEDIGIRLLKEYPALPPDERELALETLQRALQATFQESELEGYVKQQYETARASEVALKAIQVTEGKADLKELLEILENDPLEEEEQEKVFYENDLQGLYETTKGVHGLRWPLMSLNKSLGSLRPGDFGFFFARPETGKTTFLADTVTGMVSASGTSCVWINNEEGGNKVLLRCYQSALGLSTRELFLDITGNQQKFQAKVGANLRLVNDPSLHYREIERIVAETKPGLVVIDQLDKIQGFDAERYDLIMKAKYQWARELAKKHNCAVIGVCQAGGSAENKKKLEMTDVDSSWTAKQGEADWMFGIGKVDQEGMEKVRYINICKNKLVGDSDSLEEMRHGFFDVLIEPEIGKYKDRMTWK